MERIKTKGDNIGTTKNCPYCDTEFIINVHNKTYCTKKCAIKDHREKNLNHYKKRERRWYHQTNRKKYANNWYHQNKEKFKTEEWYRKKAEYYLERYYKLKGTPEFLKIKARNRDTKKRDKFCNECDSKKNLHFHHLNYKYGIGITLCSKCHIARHGGCY